MFSAPHPPRQAPQELISAGAQHGNIALDLLSETGTP
jgi:hypothetical protein